MIYISEFKSLIILITTLGLISIPDLQNEYLSLTFSFSIYLKTKQIECLQRRTRHRPQTVDIH